MREPFLETNFRGVLKNIYLPKIAIIKKVEVETGDIKTFTFVFKDKRRTFSYEPGQFMQVSVFNCGEAPISISSTPTRPRSLELTIKKVGKLTSQIHLYDEGDEIGLRGPYGRGFPMERLVEKDILFIGGGIGLAPLRSMINYVLDKRDHFGQITILYGARTPSDLVFKDELLKWKRRERVKVLITVDAPDAEWRGNVGEVTSLWGKANISAANTMAIICGPPIMTSFVMSDLLKMGFNHHSIISTLERHMKCGVGKCGHCSIGDKLVCIDGPVFTYEKISQLASSTETVPEKLCKA